MELSSSVSNNIPINWIQYLNTLGTFVKNAAFLTRILETVGPIHKNELLSKLRMSAALAQWTLKEEYWPKLRGVTRKDQRRNLDTMKDLSVKFRCVD